MIFSVFDPAARCFNYFEAPGTAATYNARGTKHRPLTEAPSGIGFAPEALAMPLPRNARAIGRGSQARGIVAVSTSEKRYRAANGLGAAQILWPAAPGRYEEEGGTISGLGDVANPTTDTEVVVRPAPYPFGQVLAAAVVASIVGVLVQKLLK